MILDALGLKYGTDKASSGHNYLHFYERLFAPLRDKPITFCEIGIGSSHAPSLKMWRDYFPLAEVIGIDNDPVKQVVGDRIVTWIGDQGDRSFLEAVAGDCGPFDVVLDDAGHSKEHQLSSFEVFRRHMRPGGFYVIEDMINREVAEMIGTLCRAVTSENDRATDTDKIRSISVFKGTAVVEFN
jgi:cephalosporin hydroxylase